MSNRQAGLWALSLVGIASSLGMGCAAVPDRVVYVQQGPAQPATVTPITAQITIMGMPQVPEGVTQMQQNCQPGAPELCNGIDDNCNGQIDEGCGYQSGQIQVTAAWNSDSDIDLHVTDPMGEEVYYGHRQSASGGVLDHDANAACSVAPPTVENVYWNTPRPPSGEYRVAVRAYNMCRSQQTPATVSISVGGRVVGTYQYVFTHQNDQFVIPFTVQ